MWIPPAAGVCSSANPPHSKMTVLGQLSHKLVWSPDFETMLQDSIRIEDLVLSLDIFDIDVCINIIIILILT